MKARKKRTKSKYTAATACKHTLYQMSVQDPPTDIEFIDRVYKRRHGKKPRILREDFCGTALMCADWVKSSDKREAIGVDLHGPTLRWAQKHNLAPLGDAGTRVQLLRQDVLDPIPRKVDVTLAFNFSYCAFKTRDALLAYFSGVRQTLGKNGGFFLDFHGGSETTNVLEEKTRHKGFTYVWDQAPYDPIRGFSKRFIHFRFPDGTEMKRAFSYDWRMWMLPEVRDVLSDAGFKQVDVYWEGADEDGSGNGIFRRVTKAEEEESWIAYIVAWPQAK